MYIRGLYVALCRWYVYLCKSSIVLKYWDLWGEGSRNKFPRITVCLCPQAADTDALQWESSFRSTQPKPKALGHGEDAPHGPSHLLGTVGDFWWSLHDLLLWKADKAFPELEVKLESHLLSLLWLREVQELAKVTQQSSILILGLLMSYLMLSPQAHETPWVKTSVRVTAGQMLPPQRQGGGGSYIQMWAKTRWTQLLRTQEPPHLITVGKYCYLT